MIDLPRPALVVLIGPSGAGKTTWARTHFASNEVVSADVLRATVGSGEADLDASVDAFTVLDAIVAARLRRGLTTVIDTLGLDRDRRRAGDGFQPRLSGLLAGERLSPSRWRKYPRRRPPAPAADAPRGIFAPA